MTDTNDGLLFLVRMCERNLFLIQLEFRRDTKGPGDNFTMVLVNKQILLFYSCGVLRYSSVMYDARFVRSFVTHIISVLKEASVSCR